MKKTIKKGKEPKGKFNDLLLPILCIIVLLPFIVHLKEYDYGFGNYEWSISDCTTTELYGYFRMIIFLIIAAFAGIILIFRMTLYKEKNKTKQIFIPLFIYVCCGIISALFSINKSAAWLGNMPDFESAFVYLGYGIMAFYTYQIMEDEKDYLLLFRAMEISFVPMAVIGWFQIFKKDLMKYLFIQKLIMSENQFEIYGGQVESIFTGNNVFLTLSNPNYAAIYLLMYVCIFGVAVSLLEKKKDKMIAGILLVNAIILLWFTYTRAALVAFFIVLIMFSVIFFVKQKVFDNKKTGLILILMAIVIFVALILIDNLAYDGKYRKRLIDRPKNNELQQILTLEDGIEIDYANEKYLLYFDESEKLLFAKRQGDILLTMEKPGEEYSLPLDADNEIFFYNTDGCLEIIFGFYDNILSFVKDEDGYWFDSAWGKLVKMEGVKKTDMHGYEYLGSGRLYIWSRIFPLLPKYMLIGSGPSTFAEVFPQNDYTGKLVYSENPGRIIEKAHNDYLMKWVQTGFISLVAILVFYIWFIKKNVYFVNQNTKNASKNIRDVIQIGTYLACVSYMICSLFSDSTLYTSPLFWVLIGLNLSVISNNDIANK